MAIKGKSKSRTPKAVTRGPKPVYQPVKKPLLARRGLWLVLAGIFGTMVVVGLIAGFIAQRNASEQDDLEERMRDTIARYQGEIDPILAAVGEPAPAGFRAFAALDQAVADLEGGAPEDAAGRRAMLAGADDVIDSADAALDALRAVDESSLLQGRGFSRGVRAVRDQLEGRPGPRDDPVPRDGGAREARGRRRRRRSSCPRCSARGRCSTSRHRPSRARYSDYVDAQVKAGTFQPPVTGGLPIPTGS